MEGFPQLTTYLDLFKKLEWEFERLNEDNENSFLAYNFFVTAWHLLEWKYPDPEGRKVRNSLRENTPILQVCEHLAVGAKHFVINNSKLRSVAGSEHTRIGGMFGSYFGGWFGGWFGGDIKPVVILEGEAAKIFGKTVTVATLAQYVMDFWRKQINIPNTSN